MSYIATLTARMIEICIIFLLVTAANALLTALHSRTPKNYVVKLTARTVEICIMFSPVSVVNALLTTLHEQRPMNS